MPARPLRGLRAAAARDREGDAARRHDAARGRRRDRLPHDRGRRAGAPLTVTGAAALPLAAEVPLRPGGAARLRRADRRRRGAVGLRRAARRRRRWSSAPAASASSRCRAPASRAPPDPRGRPVEARRERRLGSGQHGGGRPEDLPETSSRPDRGGRRRGGRGRRLRGDRRRWHWPGPVPPAARCWLACRPPARGSTSTPPSSRTGRRPCADRCTDPGTGGGRWASCCRQPGGRRAGARAGCSASSFPLERVNDAVAGALAGTGGRVLVQP